MSSTFFVPQNKFAKNTLQLLTRANYAHKHLNSNGAGIKVGLIDSGVDYTHPALGGCFGKGCKVAYGYDLVGDHFDGSSQSLRPSHDPLDNCPSNSTSATGHGTFLAGVIAADDKKYNWTGVAPGVTLGMWRVYSCASGTTPNDILIKAIEMAYKAGMDIINLSLGIHGGWEEEAVAVITSRIAAKGVHVVAANGNIGTSGIFLSGSPATGKDVIAVGSTNNEQVPGYLMKIHSKDPFSIPYRTFTNTPLKSDKKTIIKTAKNFNQTNDGCKELKGDFNHTILLVHQGGCSEIQQTQNAKKAGVSLVVFYTDQDTTPVSNTYSGLPLPVVYINNQDAHRVFRAVQKKKIKAEMTNVLVSMEAPSGDVLRSVSYFSSQGPTNELQLKPEIMGVGHNVFSTLPKYLKNYGFRSGTSFAAPFVSGQIALLLEKKKMRPEETKRVLMNFATPVRPPISDFQYGDSPIRQGAGQVDVLQAVRGLNLFQASPAFLGLNDSAHFESRQEITFHNHHKTSLTLHLSHLPSLTATGYTNDSKTPSEPVGLKPGSATVHFSQSSVSIRPGRSATVTVRFEAPKEFESDSHALYGGYIQASSAESDVTIPYLGMVGNMKDLPILDRAKPSGSIEFPFPSLGLPTGNKVLGTNETGSFEIKHANGTSTGGPYVLTRLLTGTRLVQIQVMKGKAVIGDVPISMEGIPRSYMMRNTMGYTEYSSPFYSWQWNGDYVAKDSTLDGNTSKNGRLLKKGDYRLKVRALKVFGNLKKKQDWDEWLSPQFKLVNKF